MPPLPKSIQIKEKISLCFVGPYSVVARAVEESDHQFPPPSIVRECLTGGRLCAVCSLS